MKATEEQWPEGATHKIKGVYRKWVDGGEYGYVADKWYKYSLACPLDKYVKDDRCEVIERPEPQAEYMPEVGEECLWLSDKTGVWTYTKVVAYDESSAWLKGEGVVAVDYSYEQFRPIKSERDKFIERALETWNGTYIDVRIIGVLYDNGARFDDE